MSEPLPPEVTGIAAWAVELRECLCNALDDADVPVCRCTLVPGTSAVFDQCCESDNCEGQAWVATPRIHPSGRPFPALQTTAFKCGITMLAVEYQIGVIRCSVALRQDGKPPTPDRVDYEAIRALGDYEVMLGAIVCCFVPEHLGDDVPWVLGEWQPLVRGDCAGGALSLTIGVGGCPDGCE